MSTKSNTENEYLKVLNLDVGVSCAKVKDGYLSLAYDCHPKRVQTPEAENNFKALTEACYNCLHEPACIKSVCKECVSNCKLLEAYGHVYNEHILKQERYEGNYHEILFYFILEERVQKHRLISKKKKAKKIAQSEELHEFFYCLQYLEQEQKIMKECSICKQVKSETETEQIDNDLDKTIHMKQGCDQEKSIMQTHKSAVGDGRLIPDMMVEKSIDKEHSSQRTKTDVQIKMNKRIKKALEAKRKMEIKEVRENLLKKCKIDDCQGTERKCPIIKPREIIPSNIKKEIEKQHQENERRKRDHLRRQLLDEAKNKKLEKRIKKAARRKAQKMKGNNDDSEAGGSVSRTNVSANQQVPETTRSPNTSSSSPATVGTSSSDDSCIKKLLSSLQIIDQGDQLDMQTMIPEEHICIGKWTSLQRGSEPTKIRIPDSCYASGDPFESHGQKGNLKSSEEEKEMFEQSKSRFTMSKYNMAVSFDVSFKERQNVWKKHLDILSATDYNGKTWSQKLLESPEITDVAIPESGTEQDAVVFEELELSENIEEMNELKRDNLSSLPPQRQNSVTFKKSWTSPEKEKEQFGTQFVSSVSALPKPLKLLSTVTLPVSGRWNLAHRSFVCNDLSEVYRFGTQQHDSEKAENISSQTAANNDDDDVSEILNSDQASLAHFSLTPSNLSSFSSCYHPSNRVSKAEKSDMDMPQDQGQLTLLLGSSQLQPVIRNLSIEYSSGTKTSSQGAAPDFEIFADDMSLSETLPQQILKVMLKGPVFLLNEIKYFARRKIQFYQKMFFPGPSCPRSVDITSKALTSLEKSPDLVEYEYASVSEYELQAASEKMNETSNVKLDQSPHAYSVYEYRSQESCDEVFILNNDVENPHNAGEKLTKPVSSDEHTELADLSGIPQNCCFNDLSASKDHGIDRNPGMTPCKDTCISAPYTGQLAVRASLKKENVVFEDLWSPMRQDSVPEHWDDDLSDEEEDVVIESTDRCETPDSKTSTPSLRLSEKEFFTETDTDNERKGRKEQQFLSIELSESKASCRQEVVNDYDTFHESNTRNKQMKAAAHDSRNDNLQSIWDLVQDDSSEEKLVDLKLSQGAIPKMLQHKPVTKMTEQQKDNLLSRENGHFLNKLDLKWHQSKNSGSVLEIRKNKSPEKEWTKPCNSSHNEGQTWKIKHSNRVQLLADQLDQINVDGRTENSTEKLELASEWDKRYGLLQEASETKDTSASVVMMKGLDFNSSSFHPFGLSKNSIYANLMHTEESKEVANDKEDFKNGVGIIENGIPVHKFSSSEAVVKACTDKMFQTMEGACGIDNNIPNTWNLVARSLSKAGSAGGDQSTVVCEHQKENKNSQLTSLTYGISDNPTQALTSTTADWLVNKQLTSSYLPVDIQSAQGSLYTDSYTGRRQSQANALTPGVLSSYCGMPFVSNNLATDPSLNILVLTWQQQQQRLFLLLCDLQTKILTLASAAKTHVTVTGAGEDKTPVDTLESAGSLSSEKELSFEQMESILDKLLPEVKTLNSVPENTSASLARQNMYAQSNQLTFLSGHHETNKQANQRELSDTELNAILKRLPILNCSEQLDPSKQKTTRSIKQGSHYEPWNVSSDRCLSDEQLNSILQKLPPAPSEKENWSEGTKTVLQLKVPQTKKTCKAFSALKNTGSHFSIEAQLPNRSTTEFIKSDQKPNKELMVSGLPQKIQRIPCESSESFSTAGESWRIRSSRVKNELIVPLRKPTTAPRKFSQNETELKHLPQPSVRHNAELKVSQDLGAVGMSKHSDQACRPHPQNPPTSKKPSLPYALARAALSDLKKNVAVQRAESFHFDFRLPPQSQRPILSASKKLPKVAPDVDGHDIW